MRVPLRTLGVLLLLAGLAPAASPAETAQPQARKPLQYIDSVPDTGQFLPNATLLAQVQDRKITVLDFRQAYFQVNPQVRPRGDSLGRAELLTNMVRKEVLGLTALATKRELNFEDRARLREQRRTLLSNRLYQTAVLDVPRISDDSLRTIWGYYKFEQKMRMIQFPDRAQAEAARRAITGGRASWDSYAADHTPPGLRANGGEFEWSKFEALPLDVALDLWRLKVGEYSPVENVGGLYQIYRITQRRPRDAPAFELMRTLIQDQFSRYLSALRQTAIIDEAKQGMGVRYDTTNVRWAAALIPEAVHSSPTEGVVIDENVPEFSPADTSRLLIEWNGGRISLGTLMHAYRDLPSVMRPSLNTPERLMNYADALMLEPRMVELAEKRGLEKDPVFEAGYQSKLEELLVEKMVEDSCFMRISVTPKERQDYYEKHRSGFVTYASVEYAMIVRPTREAAEAVQARLDAGENVHAILHADSLAGNVASGMLTTNSNDHLPYQKMLFEEMRPGQSRIFGPDRNNHFACVHLVSFDPGHLLPFDEVEGVVDESVRNLKGEQAINEFTDRLMRRFAVTTHYELLPRVKLTVPGDDEHL